MMKYRILTTGLLAVLGAVCVWAQKVTIDGITYKVKDNYAVVIESDKRITEAIIKSSVEIEGKTYTVTEIDDAFRGRVYLRKVSIPNSVTTISHKAFNGCVILTDLIVPDSPIRKRGVEHNIFWRCKVITSVKCNNGDFPTYIISELPYYCPFRDASKDGTALQFLNPQVAKVAQQNHPQSSSVTEEDKSTTTSDVDQNIPEATTENENTFALILACENYQEEKKVEYALNDGETFKMYCQKTLGLPEENIHIRKDATLNNIKTELDWMQKIAEAYKGTARFIVYYNGHCASKQTPNALFLLPTDGKVTLPETGYSLQELYQMLGTLPAANITMFLDTNIPNASLQPLGNTIVFTAAAGAETAYSFKGKEHALFTYYILKKLQATKGDATLGELAAYLLEQVPRKSIVIQGQSQTPSVKASATMGEDWKNLKLK